MNIIFNQQDIQCSDDCSLQEVLTEHLSSLQQFSVAVNHTFVQRADYAKTRLQPRDKIDIIQAMQGG